MQVWDREKKDCSWWNLFCWESRRAKSAQVLGTVFSTKVSCGGCENGLPPNYQPGGAILGPPLEGPNTEEEEPEEETNTGSTSTTEEPDEYASTSPSSSSDCTATIERDVFLAHTGPEGDDNYKSVDDWSECCAACGDDGDCNAW